MLDQTTSVSRPATGPASSGGGRALTRREVAVVELIAEGYSNRQIGEALSISEATVKNHVHSLLGKLQITSRVQAGVAWSSGSQNGWA
jgi:two-component system response regulator DegU